MIGDYWRYWPWWLAEEIYEFCGSIPRCRLESGHFADEYVADLLVSWSSLCQLVEMTCISELESPSADSADVDHFLLLAANVHSLWFMTYHVIYDGE